MNLKDFITQARARLDKNDHAYHAEYFSHGACEFWQHAENDLTTALSALEVAWEALERAKEVIDFCYMNQPKNKHQIEIEQAQAEINRLLNEGETK